MIVGDEDNVGSIEFMTMPLAALFIYGCWGTDLASGKPRGSGMGACCVLLDLAQVSTSFVVILHE